MLRKWLNWANYALAIWIFLFAAGGIFFYFSRPKHIYVSEEPPPKKNLPKRAFEMPMEAYKAIGETFITLQSTPASLQVPDLKKFLVYYGGNGRPDADPSHPLIHMAFAGNKTISTFKPQERLYLTYDSKQNPPQYLFSPGNAPTQLWIEVSTHGNEASVTCALSSDTGEIISEPASNAKFTLPEKEFIRLAASAWDLGKYRVDATLLARQKARWIGSDRFLAEHGGPEFAYTIGKQRIDFGEGPDLYSVFVGVHDALVWDNERWCELNPYVDSRSKPLMVIKKIDDRLMNFELWDNDGKGKVLLNLLKATEPPQAINMQQILKFVGARTRSQFIFEINKERMLLSPKDWLLMMPTGWVKLSNPQEIDDYVERKLIGPLFVFDEVERKEDRTQLKGTLYNTSRTDLQIIEIPLQQGGAQPVREGSKDSEDDEDEDDEDNDD
jgi:hypothetical protein